MTNRLPEAAYEPLLAAGHRVVVEPVAPGALAAVAGTYDALVTVLTDRVDAAVLRAGAAGRLKVVGNVAVGYDNIDVAAARACGVAVCNTPGVLDEATADVAFLLILAAARRAGDAEADLRGGGFAATGWRIDGYLGRDVHGAVLGLVGYGRIGRAVARRATGFGMTVLHHTRHPTGEAGWVAHLDDLLGRADVISLHVPLTPATHGMIGADRLACMKPTAVLVNTARGAVLDEDALADALEAGRLFGAGLDVYDGEPAVNPRLLAAPHVVALPHIGSATVETRTAMARLACHGVAEVLAGRSPANLVV